MIWFLVINSVLVTLDKFVVYADDVVILASGMFLDVISDIMTNAQNNLCNCATRYDLEVNPSKTELVLFTTVFD